MLKTSTHTPPGCVLGLLLLAAIALGAAPAAADETYVVDQSAGTGGLGALFRVDAINGNRSLVSDFGNAAQGPLGRDPLGLALEAGGTVLVADASVGTGARGALFRVNATSGNRSLVSDFANAAQGPLGLDPEGLVLEAGGAVLVIDPSAGTGNAGALFRVNAISGNRSLVSDFGNAAQGPLGLDPIGLASEAGGTVLVLDFEAGTGNAGALFRVDVASGIRSLVSDFGNAAQGPLGDDPFGLALEAGGAVLVTDVSAGTGNAGALFRVDRLSGQRTMLSDFGNAGQGDLGADPYRVAVVVPPPPAPRTCNGLPVTIQGTDNGETLNGTSGNDVIDGQGGNDVLRGRGGNDVLCGGDGRDRLFGGPGRDALDGGTGRDRCDGGAGTDTARRCEVQVRVP